ncbi:DUF932 domain-containing protein [Cronobacter sakazakii]|nr:DUF932 domain-containing protein [Cronobacter sakazakii]
MRNFDKREFTKHMLRLRRRDRITGTEVPEIILLNSHDGSKPSWRNLSSRVMVGI